MDHADIIALFDRVAAAVRQVLSGHDDWGLSGERDGQYQHDVAADEAALNILADANVGVLSEETGIHDLGRDLMIVIDPVDGSTNASIGLPWYALSLCAVRDGAAIAARVENLRLGSVFQAVAGEGATLDGQLIGPSPTSTIEDSMLCLNGYPPRYFGWRQFRTLGAAALDLAFVAAGRMDGFMDCSRDELAPWDYLGAMLLCRESGAHCVDAFDRDLVVLDHDARRAPVAAGSSALLDELLVVRRSFAA